MLGIISLLPAYDISIVIDGLSVAKLRKRLAFICCGKYSGENNGAKV
jgi:hypothetical protein